jgi:lactate dehydrogenase-like 2-hydroxyacid dehydrogenase
VNRPAAGAHDEAAAATPEVLLLRAFYPASMEWLRRECTVHTLFDAPDRAALLREVGPRVRAAIGFGTVNTPVDAALIAALPRLEIIASTGVGYDYIDVGAAVARGIVITNTPGVLDDAVADTALALLLALERRIVAGDRFVREGRWLRGGFPFTRHLADLRLGILGLGRIGLAVARRAEPFGLRISYHNRRPRADVPYAYHATLLGLAEASDVLMCIVPGGAETLHLVDEAVLRALGPQGTLVNIARGSVVDEAALVRCLQEGALGGAALDVFEREPQVPPELFAMEQVVLAPHVGSATHSTRRAMGDLVVRNVLAKLRGEPVLTPIAECAHLVG